jgi:hypothetical protein
VIDLHLRAELVETKAQRGNRTEWERERRSVLGPADCAQLLRTGRFRMCE